MEIRSRAWLGCCLFLVACSGNDSSTTAPPPPVALSVAALLPRDNEVWYPGDAEPVTVGCDRRLGVMLNVENFSLRAPAACGGATECGYAQVSLLHAVDGSLAAGPVAGAGTGLILDLSKLAPIAGNYLVHPELMTAAGTLYERNYGELPLDLSVTLASDACDTGEGGAGGAGSGDEAAGAAGVMGG